MTSDQFNVLFLFNSKGRHIATYYQGALYSPKGKNIGHYLRDEKIFIDLLGNYMGAATEDNRLLYDTFSPYINQNFGTRVELENIGALVQSIGAKPIGLPKECKDIKTPWLKNSKSK